MVAARPTPRDFSAVVPVARVRDLQHQLPALTAGEGLLEQRFDGDQPVREHPPRRERFAPSPLDREEGVARPARLTRGRDTVRR